MPHTRRETLQAALAASAGLLAGPTAAVGSPSRTFHACLSEDALDADPDLLRRVKAAGIGTVWVTGFLYGYWHYSPDRIAYWRRRILEAGMAAEVAHVPLGHPGDSLGAKSGDVPLTPPKHWRTGVALDGTVHAGTSLHPPATEENAAAVARVASLGVKRLFLDDDFRLARGPGQVGGCWCPEHMAAFLSSHGYAAARETELREDARARKLTPLLRQWLDYHCGLLTSCFRAQQAAAPSLRLGNMIMFMGSEKAGIELPAYRNSLFRVGELMFNDASFGPTKGKTDELFSALFHRRFARPELAYSETTAFPADQLSAANMAAKLAVSTIADVRNSMFMSGLTPFPAAHWDTLGPAMARHARIHEKIKGLKPTGPLKHYWGEAGRYVSDDNAYSLFLASGVPFEVCGKPPTEGWCFLGDHDAAHLLPTLKPGRTQYVVRGKAPGRPDVHTVPEALEDLWRLKERLAPALAGVPFVRESVPVVCAWYRPARAVLLWNLTPEPQKVSLVTGRFSRPVALPALGVELIEEVPA